jgi:hypothetical protein
MVCCVHPGIVCARSIGAHFVCCWFDRYSVAASVTAIASKLQYWYILCAVRFVMCMFGGVLAILEFEERLTIADIDFATPKDRFV